MLKPADPKALTLTLLSRSCCAVQVAAVLVDAWGTHAWGWNSSGPTGLGEHAEAHCLRRANRSRLAHSTLYVAAQRPRGEGRVVVVTARPCTGCQGLLKGVQAVIYRDGQGHWRGMHLHPHE